MSRCSVCGHYCDPRELIGGKCPKCMQKEIDASLQNARECIAAHQQAAVRSEEIRRYLQTLEDSISQIEEHQRELREYWANIEQCLNDIALALKFIDEWDRVHKHGIVDNILADAAARSKKLCGDSERGLQFEHDSKLP